MTNDGRAPAGVDPQEWAMLQAVYPELRAYWSTRVLEPARATWSLLEREQFEAAGANFAFIYALFFCWVVVQQRGRGHPVSVRVPDQQNKPK